MQSWLLRDWPRPRLTCAFAATATAIAALKILKSSFATKFTISNHCKADFREFSRLHGSCAHSQLLPHWKFSKVNSLLNYYIQCLQNWFLRIYPPPRLVCSFAAIVTLKSLKIQFATNFIIYNDYKTGFWEFSRLYCSCAHSQLLYYHTTCALQSTQARPGKHRCACVCMCICICTYVYICVHACVWICMHICMSMNAYLGAKIVCECILTYVHPYTFTGIYIYVYTYVCIHIYAYIHTCMCTYISIYIYMFIHSYLYTYIYTYMHIYIYAYTYMHIHIHIYIDIYIYICMFICGYARSIFPLCVCVCACTCAFVGVW